MTSNNLLRRGISATCYAPEPVLVVEPGQRQRPGTLRPVPGVEPILIPSYAPPIQPVSAHVYRVLPSLDFVSKLDEACSSGMSFALLLVRSKNGTSSTAEQAIVAATRPFDVLGRLQRETWASIALPCGLRRSATLAQAILLAGQRRRVTMTVQVALFPQDATTSRGLMSVARAPEVAP